MPIARLDKYLEICRELKEPPLHQLEELVKVVSPKIDVSNIYLPRKHLRCLLEFIEERPDVDELILDGTSLTTDDVKLLKECLLHSCVSKLSLRGIKLDATSASVLRQLCTNNPGIVELNLEGTCIPSSKIDEIQLIVNLNHLSADSLRSSNVVSVESESSRIDRWRLCREWCKPGRSSPVLLKLRTARSVIDAFVLSRELLFLDPDFIPAAFDHPLSTVDTIRWSSYCNLEDAQKAEEKRSKLEFTESTFYNNAPLCAALNALRLYDGLAKSALLRGFQQAGLYVFRLFVDGTATEVVVDDILPCLVSDDKCFLIGMQSYRQPFYAPLLEKAIAKLIGGFKRIEELSFCDCIELLTGGTSFDINLTDNACNPTFKFELLRSLSESGQKLVACLNPRSQREAQACKDNGVLCGLPYTVIKADVCRKNGAHYAYLLQIATPVPEKPIKYAFEYGAFKSVEVNGSLVVWMTLEDFAVFFGTVHLIMWSFEDAASKHKTTCEFPALSAVSTHSTLFANNSAFYLENEANSESGVMVSLRSPNPVDASNKTQCLFYKYVKLNRDGISRRYDICDKNAVFKSDGFSCNEGSIYFNLLPREKLQLSIASQLESELTVRISAVGNVKVTVLSDTMAAFRLTGEWNTTVRAKRLSDRIMCLTNESLECCTYCVLALAQLAGDSTPFPIGAFGWIGDSSGVVDVSAPQFSTAVERSVMSVHKVFLPIQPKQCLFILPYCRGSKCRDAFELTVFSATEMSRAVFDVAAFL
jgi:hypothetical protein